MTDRPDLAAMIAPLVRALITAEEPVLREHDVSMWGYAVLSALGDDEPVRSQAALAKAINADKTRIIGVLDELERRKLIERRPDPTDRRIHLLSRTEKGARLHAAIQADIQRKEAALLDRLSPADRAAFLRALATLSSLPQQELARLLS